MVVMNILNKAKIFRNLSTSAVKLYEDPKFQNKMRGWQIHSYGDLEELQYSEKLRIPIITSTTDVIVKVESTCINPIDVAMIGGYGSKLLNFFRCDIEGIEFPITLGREFAGTVIQKGMGSSKRIRIGDQVWGVVPFLKNGSHAEYVSVPEYCVSHPPCNLSVEESSSLLYAGLTAWSGIFISARLGGLNGALTSNGRGSNATTKRVLVLGASGGVGSIAVQMLAAENCTVIATCSTDAVDSVENLGAKHVIDYTNSDEMVKEIIDYSPYELILDCSGQGTKYAEKFKWNYKQYVTFNSPLLRNCDENGVGIGLMKNIVDLVESNATSASTKKGCVKWGYFVPAPQGIEYLRRLAESNKLKPIIESTFKFDEMSKAYQKVQDGHLRGKVVVTL